MKFKNKNISKLLFDLSLWFVPLIIFLIDFKKISSQAIHSEFPCLKVTLVLYGIIIGFKIINEIINKNFNNNLIHLVLKTIISVLNGAIWLCLWLYYSVVIGGLHFFGSIISYDVIIYYSSHLNEFGDLDWLTPKVTFSILVSLWVLFAAFSLFIYNKTNWSQKLIKSITLKWQLTILLVILILLIKIYIVAPSLTFSNLGKPKPAVMSIEESHNLEGHEIDPVWANKIDNQDKKIRETRENDRNNFAKTSTENEKPNLVFIVVDALRADHLGVYGYSRPTTPNLQKFMDDGKMRLVQNVHSTCSDTSCGLLSMFSSKYASQFSYHPITLHEILKDNGYNLNLILSGDHTYFYNLKPYYSKVDYYIDGTDDTISEKLGIPNFMNDDQKVIDSLKKMPDWSGKPTFFQFHLMSAHVLRPKQYYEGRYSPVLNYSIPENRSPKDEMARQNFYDNGIIYADDFIGQIINLLQEKNYLKNTIVVITGDHGDGLGEHGYFTHDNTIYEEMTHIPLILIDFNHQAAFTVQNNPYPGQVDMAPTILNELGLSKDIPSTWYGTSIGGKKQNALLYLEEINDIGLIDKKTLPNTWKYWFNSANNKEKAFNLDNDKGEKNNLIETIPADIRAKWKACVISRTSAPELKDCHS